jgi:hypothetical protein
MTLGYSLRELGGKYVVAGSMHGTYEKDVVAEAICTHARFSGRKFYVRTPDGECLERPSLTKLNEHLGNVVQ